MRKNILNSYALTLLASILSIANVSVHAETNNENWYQIEYVLFEHLNSDRHVLRYEDVKYNLPERKKYSYLSSNLHLLSPYQLKTIDESESDFVDIVKRVSASRELKTYASGSWKQAIQRGQNVPPLKITGGYSLPDGKHFQLEGELIIRRGRYMHAEINVYMADFIQLPYEDIKNWFFEPDNLRWPVDTLLSPLTSTALTFGYPGEGYIPTNLTHLKQNRRIKDGEIHYIDHPALGMIITIKEVPPPFEYGADSDLPGS